MTKVTDQLFNLFLPILAAFLALLIGGVMIALLGANPIEGYAALLEGAFGSKNALADTIVKATPLLLVGIGICISFRAGVINIGGEGQIILGALASTAVGLSLAAAPAWLIVPLALIVGFLAGAFGAASLAISRLNFTSMKF
ncbi:MAG: hypothetical protein R2880_17560 [Deinococcales bacterium]